jgi:brefeldin A-inhibited guanine nucleotide-exchange protein
MPVSGTWASISIVKAEIGILNSDTAYILAFSTIMLNTDAHSPNIKKGRMTKADFFKNNRGINDGQNLPDDFLGAIYDEIQNNEIRMKDEVEAAAGTGNVGSGLANALSNVGRDFQREAYLLQSEGMANKTEALFKTMVRSQRKGGVQQRTSDVFFSASHAEHVRPMFEVVWMPLLAGISAPLQDSDEYDLVDRSLEGFRQAIKIVCLFDLDLERNAFVTTLAKYTFLNDYSQMRSKNVEAIKCMLDVAAINGNYLKGSWKDIIICVSQLERFQLITRGVDSRSVPEVGRKQ